MPQAPQVYLDQIVKQLNQGMKRLDTANRAGEVTIDVNGIHLPRLTPDTVDKHVATLRRSIFEGRPTAQLPRILLDIDSHVRFSWILPDREPQSRSELLLTYAAILAHGTSLSAADVSRMIPELSSQAIRQMMDKIADERLLRNASDVVLAYMHRHPVAVHWGRGDQASADMMRGLALGMAGTRGSTQTNTVDRRLYSRTEPVGCLLRSADLVVKSDCNKNKIANSTRHKCSYHPLPIHLIAFIGEQQCVPFKETLLPPY